MTTYRLPVFGDTQLIGPPWLPTGRRPFQVSSPVALSKARRQ
jgi:hypothetical protein